MHVQQVCDWCAAMPASTVATTFDPDVHDYRIGGKIFALVSLVDDYVTVKVVPDDGEALRAQYAFVRPGYSMNKRHWITVDLVPEAPMDEVRALIEDSYHLVLSSLPKKRRVELLGR